MRFYLIQCRWYRKWKGGRYYLINTWVTSPFWSEKIITSCGGKILKEEFYKI